MPPVAPRKKCPACGRHRQRKFFPHASAECRDCVNDVVGRRDHEAHHQASMRDAEDLIARVRAEAGLP